MYPRVLKNIFLSKIAGTLHKPQRGESQPHQVFQLEKEWSQDGLVAPLLVFLLYCAGS